MISRNKFWIALALSIPVFVIAMSEFFSFLQLEEIAPKKFWGWIEFALATPVVFNNSWDFFKRHLSKKVMRNIKQHLFFDFVYNSLGVPVAAGILYPFFGILLSPIIAAAAMSFSSVFGNYQCTEVKKEITKSNKIQKGMLFALSLYRN